MFYFLREENKNSQENKKKFQFSRSFPPRRPNVVPQNVAFFFFNEIHSYDNDTRLHTTHSAARERESKWLARSAVHSAMMIEFRESSCDRKGNGGKEKEKKSRLILINCQMTVTKATSSIISKRFFDWHHRYWAAGDISPKQIHLILFIFNISHLELFFSSLFNFFRESIFRISCRIITNKRQVSQFAGVRVRTESVVREGNNKIR